VKKLILMVGTGLGAGFSPFFPGTVGSLWGVLIYILLIKFTGYNILWQIIVSLVFIFSGIFISGECEKILKDRDSQSIVIDEITGFLVSTIGIPFSPFFLFLAFLFFRLFDITKPFFLQKLQNLPGGLGVIADDVAAGLLANLSLRILISMAGLS